MNKKINRNVVYSLLAKCKAVIKNGIVISLILGFVSGVFASGAYDKYNKYQHNLEIQQIKDELESDYERRDFVKMNVTLRKINASNELEDTYRYYKGCFLTENDDFNIHGPEKYFLSISPNSEYYRIAHCKLYTYYCKKYRVGTEDFNKSIPKIIDHLIIDGEHVSLIYYFKLMIQDTNDYAGTKKLYDEYLTQYSNYGLDNGIATAKISKMQLIDAGELGAMEPLSFIFKTKILFSAYNSKNYSELDSLFNDLDSFMKVTDFNYITNNSRVLFGLNPQSIDKARADIEKLRAIYLTNQMSDETEFSGIE